MSSSPSPVSTSWKELMVDTLRLAARVAITLNQASLAEMKTLMGVALYRELRDRGETSEAMSITLGCSLRTVKNLSRRSREADAQPADMGALRRVLERLEEGPAARRELNRLLPFSMEFDVARVAFGVLQAEGLAQTQDVGGEDGLALTEAWADREAVDWESPLGEVDRLHRVGMSVFSRLSTEPLTLEAIADTPRLRKLPRPTLIKVLEFMDAEGMVQSAQLPASEGTGPQRVWSLTASVQRMETADPRARWRQGLMYLMERLGAFVSFTLSAQKEAVVSQHSLSFDARPEDLKPFYEALWAWVIEHLTEIDARAERLGGGVPCQLVWFAAPLGE